MEQVNNLPKNAFTGSMSIHCASVQRAILAKERWTSSGTMPFDALNVIVKGNAWIILDDEEYRLGPGDALFMMQGTSYRRGVIESDRPLDVLWIIFDACFSEQLRLFSLYPPPKCLANDTARFILRLANSALRAWRGGETAHGIKVAGLILEILALAYRAPDRNILRPCRHHSQPMKSHLPDNRAPIRQAVDFIGAHFREPLTFRRILTQTAMSSGYFCRQFTKLTGMSPMKYLEHARIMEATSLLVNTTIPVKVIAAGVGYADQYYFSRVFSRVKGISPSRFRQKGVYI